MIGYLKGTLAEVNQDSCVVDIGGVGYIVFCTAGALADMQDILDRGNRNVTLYTKLIHREDMLCLYGFLHRDEQRLFNMLITVSGIGPRQALKIIGSESTAQIVRAVVSEDDGFLRSLSGIGEKKAKQIIFDLREKLRKSFREYQKEARVDYTEAVSALVSLGFSRSEAQRAITHVLETKQGKMDTADIVEASLRFLSG